MWDKTKEKVVIELNMLRELISTHEPLFKLNTPNQIEISAVAAMLHSFYSGVENIFKLVAHEIDGNIPQGNTWHRDLLLQMSLSTPLRRGFISQEMITMLLEYLNFRHVFRHAYTMQLKWGKMRNMVANLKTVFDKLEIEIKSFFSPREIRRMDISGNKN